MAEISLVGDELWNAKVREIVLEVLRDHPLAHLDIALDKPERRALVMVLRALQDAHDALPIDVGANNKAEQALTVAEFVWPGAFADAVREDEA